jgi:hypothetical protein
MANPGVDAFVSQTFINKHACRQFGASDYLTISTALIV